MKTTSNKQTCNATSTQAKTGFLSSQKIRNAFHLNHTAPITVSQLSSQITEFASHEKENRAYEIEAELRRASARTYANPTLIR